MSERGSEGVRERSIKSLPLKVLGGLKGTFSPP